MPRAALFVAIGAAVTFGCSRPGGVSVDGATADTGSAQDGGGSDVDDGTPTRQACTSNFGNALSASPTFGRLDGYLVSIIAPSEMSSCNADDSHVHLQIQMNNEIYDIAIDATDSATHTDDVHTSTLDIPMPGNLAWSEGWHTGLSVDYTVLGVHSTDMPLDSKAEIVSTLMSDLATVNHISVYATSYGDNGAHLVHRNSAATDGLVVTEPLSTPSHERLFSFTDQSF